MRLSAVAFLMILTTMFLSGCAQQAKVAVEDHHSGFYGHGTAQAAAPVVTQQAAPVIAVAQTPVIENVTHTEPAKLARTNDAWQWPVEGKVTQSFGQQKNGTASEGITIEAAEGAPIHAAKSGQVAFVGKNIRDYGNIVILRHPDHTLTSYAHAREITVKKGDQIASGGVVGFVGHSGSAKTPQLHFAMREGDHSIDPLSKLPQNIASN